MKRIACVEMMVTFQNYHNTKTQKQLPHKFVFKVGLSQEQALADALVSRHAIG